MFKEDNLGTIISDQFSKALNYCYIQSAYTQQKQIAIDAEISPSIISHMLSNRRSYGTKTQTKVAGIFGMQLFEFLSLGQQLIDGKTPNELETKYPNLNALPSTTATLNDRTPGYQAMKQKHPAPSRIATTLAIRLKSLLQSSRKSQDEIITFLDANSWTEVEEWSNGKSLPPLEILGKIARLLDTTIDFLLDGKAEAAQTAIPHWDKIKDLPSNDLAWKIYRQAGENEGLSDYHEATGGPFGYENPDIKAFRAGLISAGELYYLAQKKFKILAKHTEDVIRKHDENQAIKKAQEQEKIEKEKPPQQTALSMRRGF